MPHASPHPRSSPSTRRPRPAKTSYFQISARRLTSSRAFLAGAPRGAPVQARHGDEHARVADGHVAEPVRDGDGREGVLVLDGPGDARASVCRASGGVGRVAEPRDGPAVEVVARGACGFCDVHGLARLVSCGVEEDREGVVTDEGDDGAGVVALDEGHPVRRRRRARGLAGRGRHRPRSGAAAGRAGAAPGAAPAWRVVDWVAGTRWIGSGCWD